MFVPKTLYLSNRISGSGSVVNLTMTADYSSKEKTHAIVAWASR